MRRGLSYRNCQASPLRQPVALVLEDDARLDVVQEARPVCRKLAADTGTPEMYQRLDAVKREMLDEWNRTKRAPKHAAWMHEKEFKD